MTHFQRRLTPSAFQLTAVEGGDHRPTIFPWSPVRTYAKLRARARRHFQKDFLRSPQLARLWINCVDKTLNVRFCILLIGRYLIAGILLRLPTHRRPPAPPAPSAKRQSLTRIVTFAELIWSRFLTRLMRREKLSLSDCPSLHTCWIRVVTDTHVRTLLLNTFVRKMPLEKVEKKFKPRKKL